MEEEPLRHLAHTPRTGGLHPEACRHPGAVIGLAVAVAVALTACGEPTRPGEEGGEFFPGQCNLEARYLFSSPVGRGGIPILDNPEFVSAEPSEENSYLQDGDRVIGLVRDGQALAIPHNILWYHEIVNLDGEEPISVTYCPITASSLAFGREATGGRRFGVSGVLFMNNLIMYDIGSGESFWPQMFGDARCGPREGTVLSRVPVVEMTWAGWKDLHPETLVVSSEVNISRDYATNPYGDYDSIESDEFLFPQMPPLDRRRPVKERVLGLPSAAAEPGIAFPFQALVDEPGSWSVVYTTWKGLDAVVLWSDQRQGGAVFHPQHPDTGDPLTFRVETTFGIVDDETGSRWNAAGTAVEGPLAGLTLEPFAEAYTAYWGAWAAFHPTTRLWVGNN